MRSRNTAPAKNTPKTEWRKVVGGILSIVVIFGTAVLALWVWNITQRHPRTHDAVVRANVVGIVPRVRGLIVKLNVQDNQEVKEGDLLFEIDPEDYQLSLNKAKAAQADLSSRLRWPARRTPN